MKDSNVLLLAKRFRVEMASQTDAKGVLHEREVVRHPGAVAILPVVDSCHICLIRNVRIAVAQTLIELPAGTLESGEDPGTTAVRELAEETGFRAGRVEHVHSFFLSPGIMDERMHLYLATDLTAGPPSCDPGEEIENLIVTWEEAIEMVLDGRIEDAKTIASLLYFDRHKSWRVAGRA